MEYNKLVGVTGMSGVFEMVTSKNDGGIVRSLEDGKTIFVSNRTAQFSHLESIEVYTTADNVNLVEVFTAMQASKEALPAEKDQAAVKAYFAKVFPTLDFERVYNSDMKKMVKWFKAITDHKIEIKLSSQTTDEAGATPATDAPKAKIAKPTSTEPKAAAPKKSAPAKKINSPRKMA
jgi:hypothetical protein